ncbi:hypothetical protein Ddye_031405 [Dipteronia dyeriana]|uniref:Uncharacterized protein n=1 Tax=Dipteronia dyeriana TaxID=168575 RepID=A0AAD9TIT0_9ROSI|nr:hypothetical protein Ddye_031405 [Dipteronia dyeriana]
MIEIWKFPDLHPFIGVEEQSKKEILDQASGAAKATTLNEAISAVKVVPVTRFRIESLMDGWMDGFVVEALQDLCRNCPCL